MSNAKWPLSCMRALGVCNRPTPPQSLVVRVALRERIAGPLGGSRPVLSGRAATVSPGWRSSAGPCVERNRMSCSEACCGQPLSREGAHNHAPGAGSSCTSLFQRAMP